MTELVASAATPRTRPVICDAREVKGILDGTVTQLWRPVVPQPTPELAATARTTPDDLREGASQPGQRTWLAGDPVVDVCPFGEQGELLWVREGWAAASTVPTNNVPLAIEYRADSLRYRPRCDRRWRSPANMPRWASRLTLEIEDIRLQRVQHASELDAVAQGATPVPAHWQIGLACGMYYCRMPDGKMHYDDSAFSLFQKLWIQQHGEAAWAANWWAWAITVRRHDPPAAR